MNNAPRPLDRRALGSDFFSFKNRAAPIPKKSGKIIPKAPFVNTERKINKAEKAN